MDFLGTLLFMLRQYLKLVDIIFHLLSSHLILWSELLTATNMLQITNGKSSEEVDH
jgi:hypothetical protein